MTVETIKDQLAKFHFSVLAARAGCKVISYNFDDGVDVGIDQPFVYDIQDHHRYTSMGKLVEFQLKTTTEKSVTISGHSIKYDLDIKNLNDLIQRRKIFSEGIGRAPLMLGLLLLPNDPKQWVVVLEKSTTIFGSIYWFYPPVSFDLSGNKSTQRIEIPLQNKVDLFFFEEVFNLRFKFWR